MSLLYIVCNCNLIIYPYFRPNLLLFSFLIILYIFNITRSLVLRYYLVDYLKYIPDKNLYIQVSLLGKIIILFILSFFFLLVISDIKLLLFPPPPSFFLLIPIMPPVTYTFVPLASRLLMLAILILCCQGLPSCCLLL
jgi:hypothetical protein